MTGEGPYHANSKVLKWEQRKEGFTTAYFSQVQNVLSTALDGVLSCWRRSHLFLLKSLLSNLSQHSSTSIKAYAPHPPFFKCHSPSLSPLISLSHFCTFPIALKERQSCRLVVLQRLGTEICLSFCYLCLDKESPYCSLLDKEITPKKYNWGPKMKVLH